MGDALSATGVTGLKRLAAVHGARNVRRIPGRQGLVFLVDMERDVASSISSRWRMSYATRSAKRSSLDRGKPLALPTRRHPGRGRAAL